MNRQEDRFRKKAEDICQNLLLTRLEILQEADRGGCRVDRIDGIHSAICDMEKQVTNVLLEMAAMRDEPEEEMPAVVCARCAAHGEAFCDCDVYSGITKSYVREAKP